MSPISGTRLGSRTTTRRRGGSLAARGGVFAVGLTLLLTLPTSASADPGDPVTPIPDALTTLWDNPSDSLNLAWDGSVYGRAVGSFVGEPLAVPGDQIWRTLNVTNAGPDDADLTVRITSATTEDPEGDLNTDFEDISIIHWDVDGTRGSDAFRDVRSADPLTLAVIPVTKGETVPVTIGYEFPFEETAGRNLGQPSQILSFDVELILRGDTPPSPADTTETTATTPPDTSTAEPNDIDTGTAQPDGNDIDTGTAQPDGNGTGSAIVAGTARPASPLAFTGVAIGGTILAAALAITLGLLLTRRRHQELAAPAPRHTT